MKIFVGNLSFEAKEIDVQKAFAAFGEVASVVIVMEKKGKKSRGFGFVDMPDEQGANDAIAQLQGREILGRPINVMPAVSKEPVIRPAGKKNPTPGAPVEHVRPEYKRREPRGSFSFERTGKYKQGRRSLNYAKKRLESGIATEPVKRRDKPNPMRWRKKPRWQASSARPESSALNSPEKSQIKSKPWEKKSYGSKPPRVFGEGSGPRKRAFGKPASVAAGSQEKPQTGSKPWEKKSYGPKPWKKAQGEFRPWKKEVGKPGAWRKGGAKGGRSGYKKFKRFGK